MAFDYGAFKRGMGSGGNPFVGAMMTGVMMEEYRDNKRNKEYGVISGNLERLETDHAKVMADKGLTANQAWQDPTLASRLQKLSGHRYFQEALFDGRDELDRSKGLQMQTNDSGKAILVGFRKDNGEAVPFTIGKSSQPGDPIVTFSPTQGVTWMKGQVAEYTGAPTALNPTDVYEESAVGGLYTSGAKPKAAPQAAAPQTMGTLPAPPSVPIEPPAPTTFVGRADAVVAKTEADRLATEQKNAADSRAVLDDYTGRGAPPTLSQEFREEEKARKEKKEEPEEPKSKDRRALEQDYTGRGAPPILPEDLRNEEMARKHDNTQDNFVKAYNEAETGEEKFQIREQAEREQDMYDAGQAKKVEPVKKKIAKVNSNDPDTIVKNMTKDDMDVITKDVAKNLSFYQGTIRGRAALAATARFLGVGIMGGDTTIAREAAHNFVQYGTPVKPKTAMEKYAANIDLVGKLLENRTKSLEIQKKVREGGKFNMGETMAAARPVTTTLVKRMLPDVEGEEAINDMADQIFLTSTHNSMALTAGMNDAKIGFGLGPEGKSYKQEAVKYSLSTAYHAFLEASKGDGLDTAKYTFAYFMKTLGDVDAWWHPLGPSESEGKEALAAMGLTYNDLRNLTAAYRNYYLAEQQVQEAGVVPAELDDKYFASKQNQREMRR